MHLGDATAPGCRLKLLPPKMTPRVKELLILILPATIGAGVYYISQLFYTYFATRLPEGSFVYFSQADRLNQLPLALDRLGDRHGHPAGHQPPCRLGEERQAAHASRARRPSWRCC